MNYFIFKYFLLIFRFVGGISSSSENQSKDNYNNEEEVPLSPSQDKKNKFSALKKESSQTESEKDMPYQNNFKNIKNNLKENIDIDSTKVKEKEKECSSFVKCTTEKNSNTMSSMSSTPPTRLLGIVNNIINGSNDVKTKPCEFRISPDCSKSMVKNQIINPKVSKNSSNELKEITDLENKPNAIKNKLNKSKSKSPDKKENSKENKENINVNLDHNIVINENSYANTDDDTLALAKVKEVELKNFTETKCDNNGDNNTDSGVSGISIITPDSEYGIKLRTENIKFIDSSVSCDILNDNKQNEIKLCKSSNSENLCEKEKNNSKITNLFVDNFLKNTTEIKNISVLFNKSCEKEPISSLLIRNCDDNSLASDNIILQTSENLTSFKTKEIENSSNIKDLVPEKTSFVVQKAENSTKIKSFEQSNTDDQMNEKVKNKAFYFETGNENENATEASTVENHQDKNSIKTSDDKTQYLINNLKQNTQDSDYNKSSKPEHKHSKDEDETTKLLNRILKAIEKLESERPELVKKKHSQTEKESDQIYNQNPHFLNSSDSKSCCCCEQNNCKIEKVSESTNSLKPSCDNISVITDASKSTSTLPKTTVCCYFFIIIKLSHQYIHIYGILYFFITKYTFLSKIIN